MPAGAEHEAMRGVVFRTAPAVGTERPRRLPRFAGGAISLVLFLTVFGLVMLGGSAFWTAFEPPGRTPSPPLWMEPPEPGSQSTQVRDNRRLLEPQPVTRSVSGTVRSEEDSALSGSGSSSGVGASGGGDGSKGSNSGSDSDDSSGSGSSGSGSSGSNSGPGSGSGDGDSSGSGSSGSGSSGSNSGPGSGSGGGDDDSSGSGSSGSGSSGSGSSSSGSGGSGSGD